MVVPPGRSAHLPRRGASLRPVSVPAIGRKRPLQVPSALLALLLVATVELLAWSIAVPALQEPDEASHFSYAQAIAERGEIPWHTSGGPRGGLEPLSSEQQVASVWAGLEPLLANPAARPLWTEADESVWRTRDAALGPDARSVIEPSSAFANPPVAYVYDAAVYTAVGGSFFDRLFALRWANLPLLLVMVAATWALARELFEDRPAAVVLATAVVALQPLLTSVAGGVTPDVLLCALFATGLALSVRIVRRGPTTGRLVALALVSLLAPLTHGRGLALLVPAGLAVLLSWPPLRRLPRPTLAAGVGLAAVAVAALALRYAERGGPTLSGTRGFASYLWQFYLPRLPWMNPPPFQGWTIRDVYVDRLYGTFGQLEITLPGWVTDTLADAAVVLAVGALVAAIVRRHTLRRLLAPIAVLAAAAISAILLVHLQAYRGLLDDPGDPVITGRYLLPLLPLLGVGVAATLQALPRRAFAVAGGGVLAAAVLLQLAALGAMLTRFYA
jgi:hypothetical protein